MEKVITLRYQSKCSRCNRTIPAGDRAVWLGENKGVRHERCDARIEPELPKEAGKNVDRFTLDYSRLREDFFRFLKNPADVYSTPGNAKGSDLRESWKGNWAGCSTLEMEEFLRTGYRVEGLEGVTSLIPARPRRKIRYAEEGDELNIALALEGDDLPFMEWEKRVSKPGLSVEIHMVFDCYFPAKTIVQYQRWIARALQTLDESGVDMEVSIVNSLSGLFRDEYGVKTETLIRVRKAGEASDFANWSAMFSPGGYRMLGIMATGIHADTRGKRIGYGYGSVRDYGKWTVAYDPERNVIVFGNSTSDQTFPEFDMTEKLQAVLGKVNG